MFIISIILNSAVTVLFYVDQKRSTLQEVSVSVCLSVCSYVCVDVLCVCLSMLVLPPEGFAYIYSECLYNIQVSYRYPGLP